MTKLLHSAFLMMVAVPLLASELSLPEAVVKGDWLKTQVNNKQLVIIDIQEAQLYQRHHIPHAVNMPFSQWRSDTNAHPAKSLLPIKVYEERLGKLGVTAHLPIVIVAGGSNPGDLSAMARVYWTMKVLGHKQVAILSGGLISYVNEYSGDFHTGDAEKRFPSIYKAMLDLTLIATTETILEAKMPLLDARSLEEHVGLVSGKGERSGSIPNAHHLPFDWLGQDQSGVLKSKEALQKLFNYADLKDDAAIHFCHTGNRASLTWFADYAVLGRKSAKLYDASMLEWGKDHKLPIETKLQQ